MVAPVTTAARLESAISHSVADVWRKLGAIVVRIQSGRVPVRGGWMQLAEKGTPDLLVLGANGRCFWAETKTEKKDATTEQIDMHYKLRRLGFPVYIIRNEADALEAWRREMG